MADLLARGSAWLAGQRKRFGASAVTYRRGESSVSILATVGRTERQIDEGNGLLTRVESRDYLVTAADLVIGGAAVFPRAADQVVEADGSVYELMDFPGEGFCRWSDPYRVTLRIHTKRVSA